MISKSIHGNTIKKLLGTGGMAEIYYAETSLGRPVAVKVLKREYSENSIVKKRFIAEAKTTVKLFHHNIREVYDQGEIDGRPVIIMEYLEGQSLWEVLKDRGKVNEEKALIWFYQTVSGLQYAHSQGVIHRDIKPSNLFLTRDGTIKILDFGIAKVMENFTMTQTGQTLGTLIYMSPEQVIDPKRVDERTDIYSLGVTYYHLVTGKMPYDITTDSSFIIQKKIVEEELDLDILTYELKNVLKGFLTKDRSKRKWNGIGKQTCVKTINMGDDNTSILRVKSGEEEVLPFYDSNENLWGIKKGNRIVLDAKYSNIYPFLDGVAKVERNGMWGFVDKLGKKMCPLKYDFVDSFKEGFARVKLNNKRGFINKEGKEIVPLKYEFVNSFSDGLARVKLKMKWGYVNTSGQEIIPLDLDYANDFVEGIALVERDGSWSFIDKRGVEIFSMPYDFVDWFSEDIARVRLKGKWGFIDRTGKEIIVPKYSNSGNFSEGLARVKEYGKWGYIDEFDTVIIPIKYDNAYAFARGLAKVDLNGDIFYINTMGEFMKKAK